MWTPGWKGGKGWKGKGQWGKGNQQQWQHWRPRQQEQQWQQHRQPQGKGNGKGKGTGTGSAREEGTRWRQEGEEGAERCVQLVRGRKRERGEEGENERGVQFRVLFRKELTLNERFQREVTPESEGSRAEKDEKDETEE